jgi:cytochrome c oxidase subunit II
MLASAVWTRHDRFRRRSEYDDAEVQAGGRRDGRDNGSDRGERGGAGRSRAADGLAARLQQSATPVMDNIIWFHDFLLWIITRSRCSSGAAADRDSYGSMRAPIRRRPRPRTTRCSKWPGRWCRWLILVAIAVPSFKLLFLQLNIPPAELTVKATGKQWFWTYAYPDQARSSSTSLMLQDAELKPGQPRLLAVDNDHGGAGQQGGARSGDRRRRDSRLRGALVRHQDRRGAGPSQRDLVPGDPRGHLLRAMLRIVRRNHAFMPIAVRVVSDQDYAAWLERRRRNSRQPPTTASRRRRCLRARAVARTARQIRRAATIKDEGTDDGYHGSRRARRSRA